jgi:hypothetical protein
VVLWCGLGKSARLARVRGSPVRYVIRHKESYINYKKYFYSES